MKFIEKRQGTVIRNFLSEVAKIIEVYCKAIVECDCNRMRQNAADNCVQTSKYSRRLLYSAAQCLVTPAEMGATYNFVSLRS